MKRAQCGFTVLEAVVASMVFGVLAFILLDRLYYYQGLAEKTTVEMTVMNMRSGLRYKVADMLLHEKEAELPWLAGQNPILWLESPPAMYRGEVSGLEWSDLPPGSWGFDVKKGELLYRVRSEKYFEPARRGDAGLRFRVRSLKGPLSQGGQESVVGAEIQLLANYRWF